MNRSLYDVEDGPTLGGVLLRGSEGLMLGDDDEEVAWRGRNDGTAGRAEGIRVGMCSQPSIRNK